MWGLMLAAGTIALVISEHNQYMRLRTLAKFVAVVAFLAAAYTGDLHAGSLATQAIVAALVASAVGDIVLLGRTESALLVGLGAFLLGHIGYIVAFWAMGVSATGVIVCALPMIVFGGWVNRWLAPYTGDLARPVVAYIVVICAMVIAAGGAAWSQPDTGRLVLGSAAVVFVLSDLCVAFDRFISPGPWVRTVGLPLYFGAQWLFVQGAIQTLAA